MEDKQETVAVIGAGVAGLTAAHLLMQAGFKVTVIEGAQDVGGQAKSGYTAENYPTEHSLRVVHENYGCFYRILSDLRKENIINKDFNLLYVDGCLRYNEDSIFLKKSSTGKTSFYQRWKNIVTTLCLMFKRKLWIRELFSLLKLQYLQTISEARLVSDYDYLTVNELLHLNHCSKVWFDTVYKIPLIGGGAKKHSSAVLSIALLEAYSAAIKDVHSLKMFDGPNSEALFNPWKEYLMSKGVDFILEEKIQKFSVEENTVTATLTENQNILKYDNYILAANYENAKNILEESHLLENINFPNKVLDQCFEWSNGAQFYFFRLPEDKEFFYPGLASVYLESPWGLVTIIQGKQFWNNFGKVNKELNILSVTFSDALSPGILYGKALINCNLDEIKEELFAQCGITDKSVLIGSHLDNAIQYLKHDELKNIKDRLPNGAFNVQQNGILTNQNRFLTPIPGYYHHAPAAITPIANLYLAGEYCTTSYKIPTMEKACESGFHAVNALLKRKNKKSISFPYCYDNHHYYFLRYVDALFFRFFKRGNSHE